MYITYWAIALGNYLLHSLLNEYYSVRTYKVCSVLLSAVSQTNNG